MIKNEREYRIAKAQVRRFERSLRAADSRPAPADVHPLLVGAARAALTGELDKLRDEVADYEQLKGGARRQWTMGALSDVPMVLIEARIARNMTHRVLAERLGLPEQQVQRYEATEYRGVGLERLQQVADSMGLALRIEARVAPDEVASSRSSVA